MYQDSIIGTDTECKSFTNSHSKGLSVKNSEGIIIKV